MQRDGSGPAARDPAGRRPAARARPPANPLPPDQAIATGLNVARNVGHINVLRIIRATGGAALAVDDDAIRATVRAEWRRAGFAWSPEGAATLAVLPELADRGLVRPGDRVVLVNTAAPEKYAPTIGHLFDGG